MNRLLVMLLFVSQLSGAVLALPQSPQPASPPAPTVAVPRQHGPIDGSRNPELISEEQAAVMIISALVIPSNPTEMQERRFQMFTERIGLGGRDKTTLRREMNRLHELLTPIETQLSAARDALALIEARRSLREESYKSLIASLSSGGAKRLRKYVEEQKRNMRFGSAPPGSASRYTSRRA
jgi:hypothetical protein